MTTKTAKKCERAAEFYASQFKDVPRMSSSELLERQKEQDDNSNTEIKKRKKLVLVDVRSKAEQEVSMIAGSISLETFETEIAPSLARSEEEEEGENKDDDPTVVTYCTIGYRSGMEARRLKQKYKLRDIRNLDGIVAYTHASSSIADENNNNDDENENENAVRTPKLLVDPRTNKETTKVHTFGPTWSFVSDDFEATHFSTFQFLARTLAVVWTSLVRTLQRWGAAIKSIFSLPQAATTKME